MDLNIWFSQIWWPFPNCDKIGYFMSANMPSINIKALVKCILHLSCSHRTAGNVSKFDKRWQTGNIVLLKEQGDANGSKIYLFSLAVTTEHVLRNTDYIQSLKR